MLISSSSDSSGQDTSGDECMLSQLSLAPRSLWRSSLLHPHLCLVCTTIQPSSIVASTCGLTQPVIVLFAMGILSCPNGKAPTPRDLWRCIANDLWEWGLFCVILYRESQLSLQHFHIFSSSWVHRQVLISCHLAFIECSFPEYWMLAF